MAQSPESKVGNVEQMTDCSEIAEEIYCVYDFPSWITNINYFVVHAARYLVKTLLHFLLQLFTNKGNYIDITYLTQQI